MCPISIKSIVRRAIALPYRFSKHVMTPILSDCSIDVVRFERNSILTYRNSDVCLFDALSGEAIGIPVQGHGRVSLVLL